MLHHTLSNAEAKSVPIFCPCFVIPLLGCLYNGVSTSSMNILVDWEWCHHLYGRLKLMAHHILSNAEQEVHLFMFHPRWSNLGVLCGQYVYDPLVWWFINLTHALIDELRGVSVHVWMVGVHATSHTIQDRGWNYSSFHLSTHGTSFGCYEGSMDVILLFCCVYTGEPTSSMHPLMNWEGCQHLCGWLEIMVHHTPSKARARSVPVFTHQPMVHPWSVCSLYGCEPLDWLLVQWQTNLTHEHIDELRGIPTPTWMVGAHVTSHTIQGRGWKCSSFLSSMLVHPWSIVWPVCMWPLCFVDCVVVYQPHPCTHRYIERGANACINGWSSWYITHHPMQEQ